MVNYFETQEKPLKGKPPSVASPQRLQLRRRSHFRAEHDDVAEAGVVVEGVALLHPRRDARDDGARGTQRPRAPLAVHPRVPSKLTLMRGRNTEMFNFMKIGNVYMAVCNTYCMYVCV